VIWGFCFFAVRREAPYFTDAERAAPAVAESVIRLADSWTVECARC